MRYKPVPEPRPRGELEAIQSAVPLVPGSTADCCARIVERTAVESRDEARQWLTFLQALGLVEARNDRFVRTDRSPTDDAVATAFRDNVYAAREVIAFVTSASQPVSAGTVANEVDIVPRWEQDRSTDAPTDWEDRITALLEWARIFEFVTRTETGYATPDTRT